MKKQSNVFDYLAGLAFKLICMILLVLLFASVEFDNTFTISKKKNSIINDVSNVVDSGFSLVKTVKKWGK